MKWTFSILPEPVNGKTIVLVRSSGPGRVDVVVRGEDREAAIEEARYLVAVLNRKEG